MKFQQPQTLASIAELIGVEYVGDPSHEILGINEIHRIEKGDIVFVDHPKYYEKALNCDATTIIINQKVEAPEGKALLISKEPFSDFVKILKHFNPFQLAKDNMGENVSIGEDTEVHPSAYIGNNVVIGDNCFIHPNVCIYDNTFIGNNVTIQANTVIGSSGFYYKKREDFHERLYSAGKVVIEDNVELGACCTIDKGVTAETKIGKGTVFDNHVHIGHDTLIGKMCLFAAHVGIAGCVTIEDNVTLWGQVGIASNVTIGKGAVLFAQSGVSKSLDGGVVYFGSPAEEAKKKMKELAMIRKLPEIIEKLK